LSAEWGAGRENVTSVSPGAGRSKETSVDECTGTDNYIIGSIYDILTDGFGFPPADILIGGFLCNTTCAICSTKFAADSGRTTAISGTADKSTEQNLSRSQVRHWAHSSILNGFVTYCRIHGNRNVRPKTKSSNPQLPLSNISKGSCFNSFMNRHNRFCQAQRNVSEISKFLAF
jgi:hypothetical protein